MSGYLPRGRSACLILWRLSRQRQRGSQRAVAPPAAGCHLPRALCLPGPCYAGTGGDGHVTGPSQVPLDGPGRRWCVGQGGGQRPARSSPLSSFVFVRSLIIAGSCGCIVLLCRSLGSSSGGWGARARGRRRRQAGGVDAVLSASRQLQPALCRRRLAPALRNATHGSRGWRVRRLDPRATPRWAGGGWWRGGWATRRICPSGGWSYACPACREAAFDDTA